MLYDEAARILKLVENSGGGARNLTFSSSYSNKGQLRALVYETLKYSHVLQQILNATNLLSLEKSLNDVHLAKVLVYDALLGEGIEGDGTQENAVRKHSALLRSELDKLKTKMNVQSYTDLLSPTQSFLLPRYVRINTLKTSVAEVVEHFCNDGYRLVSVSDQNFEQYIQTVKGLKQNEFVRDIHVQELLAFPAGTDLHKHKLFLSGDIILQDKGSCIPAMVLNPASGSQVIDCCAAPGNKATFLAALMNNKGKIFAFDRDGTRLASMLSLLKKTSSNCIVAAHKDFRHVNPLDPKYKDVEYIIVDPSCSGSGMVDQLRRFDHQRDSADLERRLKSLSSFQAMLLRHSLKFPAVRRVVYSTCSLYERENELVVADVLRCQRGLGFQLVQVLPSFPFRGDTTVLPGADRCVRLSPETSLTGGFFIACLERRVSSDSRCPSTCDQPRVNSGAGEAQVESDAGEERRTAAAKGGKSRKERSDRVETSVAESNSALRPILCDESERIGDALGANQDGADVRRHSHKKEGKKAEAGGAPGVKASDCNSELHPSSLREKAGRTEGTGDTWNLKADVVEACQRSHKRKKARRAKDSTLEAIEGDGACVNYPNLQLNLREESVAEGVTACDDGVEVRKNSHKRKTPKKDRAFEAVEVDGARCDSEVQPSSCAESFSEGTAGASDAKLNSVKKCRKSPKRKKSRKERVAETEEVGDSGEVRMNLREESSSVETRAAGDLDAEQVGVGEYRKLPKRKKSKKRKASAAVDVKAADSNSEFRPSSLREKAGGTDGTTLNTEADGADDCRKSRKRKRPKKERAATFSNLELNAETAGDLERLESAADVQLLELLAASDELRTEEVAAVSGDTRSRNKKSKKGKFVDVDRSETGSKMLNGDSSEASIGGHFGENASLVSVQDEHSGAALESSELRKRKKSKKTKTKN